MARTKYLKNTRLKTTLSGYAKDLDELINIKPKQFDIATIATMITETPPRKWRAAQAIVDATVEKKQWESDLKRLRAIRMLEASSVDKKYKLSNADDRKAYVDNDSEVQAAEIELINAEANLTAAKLGYECLDDLFTAGKKIMDYLIDQEKATKQYDRFVNEGRKFQ